MKVITIGRSSKNDITVNNPKVSRHHCQIVHFDNGTFGIVDLGSVNGTFVNGQRVHRQTRLKRGDRVHLSNTEVPWQQYFTSSGANRKSRWIWPVVAGAAAVVVAATVLVLTLFLPKNISYKSSKQDPAPVLYTENGEQYSIYAIPGEIIVIFDNDVNYREAKRIIKQNGGKIISQTPKNHYYIVSVNSGEEDAFIQKVHGQVSNLVIYPNAVSSLCMAKPVVVDNFKYVYKKYNATHGKMVIKSFNKGKGDKSHVDFHDVGISENSEYINSAAANKYLQDVLEKASEKNSPVINMSFGPGFLFHDNFWDDAPVLEKKLYRLQYYWELRSIIWAVRNYDDRDFIIVKSLGNDGVKNFDKDILQSLMDYFSDWEKAILDRHFLLVAAKDDSYTTYSNDMSPGTYHPLIAKTDISDMRFNQLRMHGTSYSSPRAAGFISKVMNDYDISAVEALQYAKQATRHDPNHLLTYDNLNALVKKDKENNSDNNVANSANSQNNYTTNGCLKYRLIKGNELENERLELHNACNEDIRVTGYLLNAIAPHGGENTLDFEIIVRANGTDYVEGFLENECTIKSVEKVPGTPSEPASSSNPTSRQSIPSNLIGTRWTTPQIHDNWTGKKRTLDFINRNQVVITYETLFFLISTSDEVPAPEVVRYNCYYDSKLDRIVVLNNKSLKIMEFKYKDGRLIDPGANSLGDIEYIKL